MKTAENTNEVTTPETVFAKPLDESLQYIAQAVHQWKAENTPELIKSRVISQLNKNTESMVLKLLGFDDCNFRGGWSLDHCNGRAGDSAAGDYLRQHKQEAIEGFFKELSIDAFITTALKKKLISEFHREFESQLILEVRNKAKQVMTTHVNALVDEIAKSDNEERFHNMLKLIGAEK